MTADAPPLSIFREREVRSRQHLGRYLEWCALPDGHYQKEAWRNGPDFNFGATSESELLREWWRSVADLLTQMGRQGLAGTELPRPLDLYLDLGSVLGHLAVGEIPAAIEGVRTRGQTAPGPREAADIALAVAYIKAAREGLMHEGTRIEIVDRAPVKKITELFGVHSSTVRDWQRRSGPASLGIGPLTVDQFERRVEAAGERYRIGGRSAKAVASRSRKRRALS